MTLARTSSLVAGRYFVLVLLGPLAGCSIDPRTDLSPGDAGTDGGGGDWVENSESSQTSPGDDGDNATERDASTPPKPTQGSNPVEECVHSHSNLLQNPSFEANVEDWVLPKGELLVVSSRDDTGSTSSGALSLQLDMSHMDGSPGLGRVIGGAVQCVSIQPNTEYQVATGYRIESGKATTASITAFQYENADCSGDFLAVWSSVEGADNGEWEYLVGTFETKNEAVALGLRLNVAAPASAGAGSVLYDDVYLSTAPFCAETKPSSDDSVEPADAGPKPSDDATDVHDAATDDDSQGAESEPDESNEPEPVDTGSNGTDDPDDSEPTSAESDSADAAAATDNPTEPEEPSAPSYAETVEPIFLASCVAACHEADGLGGPGKNAAIFGALDLSEGNGYASLVGISSEQVEMSIVGDTAEDSYLWYKLLGTQADVGSADSQLMPFGLDQLDDEQIQVVVDWIEGGAAP